MDTSTVQLIGGNMQIDRRVAPSVTVATRYPDSEFEDENKSSERREKQNKR